MSYQQFLNNLVTPISSFITWFGTILNYLITNYFFITLLGITLISSLLFYFLSNIIYNVNSCKKDLDNVYYKK